MAEARVGCAEFMAETTRSSQPGDAGTNSLAATDALPRLVDFATGNAASSDGCMSCASCKACPKLCLIAICQEQLLACILLDRAALLW